MPDFKIEIDNTPLFLIIEDRKIQLDMANISIEKTSSGAKLHLTGMAGEMNQVNDLVNYLQSIAMPIAAV
jgi:hypothetical protein